MVKPTVYVARQIPQGGLEALAQHAELRVHEQAMPPTRAELLSGVHGVDGILSLLSDRIDAEVMDAAGDRLRVISNFAVGFNNIDVPEARRRGIAVGNTPDVLTDATADMAVSLVLAVARRLREAWQAVESGGWKTWEPLGWLGVELHGKTLGIVGMGRIGEAVAARLAGGWGMKVLYTARQAKPDAEKRTGAIRVELDELLAASDVVSLHVPLSEETRHLIGRRELGRMRPDAILVNTARGEIVDQAALYEALENKQLHGAGLDVCTPEPLPVDDPLLKQARCIVVPHIGSATVLARNAMADRAVANLLAGLESAPLPFPVS